MRTITIGDNIDLLNTVATGDTSSGGILHVKNGTTSVANLHFAWSFSRSNFHLSSDGHGGTLYLMLENRIYLGKVVHKDRHYPGLHAPIDDYNQHHPP